MSGTARTRKPAKPTPWMKERTLHLYVAQLLKLKGVPYLMVIPPMNEGKRSPRTGAFMKRMGMYVGAADFMLWIPSDPCGPGFPRPAALELKTAVGRQSPEQKGFEVHCRVIGIPYALARTPEQAAAFLLSVGAISA